MASGLARLNTDEVIALRGDAGNPDAVYATDELRMRARNGDRIAISHLLGPYDLVEAQVEIECPSRWKRVVVVTEGGKVIRLRVLSTAFYRTDIFLQFTSLLLLTAGFIGRIGKPLLPFLILGVVTRLVSLYFELWVRTEEAKAMSTGVLVRTWIETREEIGPELLHILNERAKDDEPLQRMLRRFGIG